MWGARASWRFLNKNSSIMMQRSRAHHTSESPRKKRKQNRVDFSHEWKRNSGKEVEEIEIPGVSSLDVHEIGWTARKAQADECNWIFFCEEEKKRKISTDVLGCGGCWLWLRRRDENKLAISEASLGRAREWDGIELRSSRIKWKLCRSANFTKKTL